MKKEPLVSCSTSQSQPKPSFQLVTNNLGNLTRVGGTYLTQVAIYFKPFFYQDFSQNDSDTLKNKDTRLIPKIFVTPAQHWFLHLFLMIGSDFTHVSKYNFPPTLKA